MTDHINDCEWIPQRIPVPIKIGELCLWRPVFSALKCSPDIFATTPLSTLRSPATAMRNNEVQLAYAYSYPLATDVHRVSISSKILCIVDSVYKHFYVETKGDFAQYLSLKKSKTVSTLKRKTRKVEATNGDDKAFVVYSTPDEFDEFFRLALPVSEKSYQHRLLNQGLPNTEQFKDEVLKKSAQGRVLGFILKVDGKPVAYNLCPLYGETKVLYDYTGYDQDYANYSPGTVLQFKIIEDLFQREGIEYYDLCTGEGIHKEIFATGYENCGNIYFCSLTLKNLALFSLRAVLALVTNIFKKLLTLFKLKSVVKNFIRKSA